MLWCSYNPNYGMQLENEKIIYIFFKNYSFKQEINFHYKKNVVLWFVNLSDCPIWFVLFLEQKFSSVNTQHDHQPLTLPLRVILETPYSLVVAEIYILFCLFLQCFLKSFLVVFLQLLLVNDLFLVSSKTI